MEADSIVFGVVFKVNQVKYYLRCHENDSPKVVQAVQCMSGHEIRKATEQLVPNGMANEWASEKWMDQIKPGCWFVAYPTHHLMEAGPEFNCVDDKTFRERYFEINVEDFPLSYPIERSFGMKGEDHQFVQWIEHVRSLTGGIVTDFSWRDCYRQNLTPENALKKYLDLAHAHVQEEEPYKPKTLAGVLRLLSFSLGITEVTLEQIDAVQAKLINHGASLQIQKDLQEKELTEDGFPNVNKDSGKHKIDETMKLTESFELFQKKFNVSEPVYFELLWKLQVDHRGQYLEDISNAKINEYIRDIEDKMRS